MGETDAEPSKALGALPEESGLILCTYKIKLCNSSSEESNTLCWPLEARGNSGRQANIHTHKSVIKIEKTPVLVLGDDTVG